MSEKNIQTLILLAASKIPGVTVYRHNVGNGVVGKVKDLGGGHFHVIGHRMPFGLCPGGSDIIGFRTVTVDGKPFARFIAIEVKSETGTLEPDQKHFIEFVRAAGGIAIVARSVEEAVAGLVNSTLEL